MAKKQVWVIKHETKGSWIKMNSGRYQLTIDPVKAYEFSSREMAWVELVGLREQDSKKFAKYTIDMRSSLSSI